jgi:PAS domain S-box-containing protein
MPAGTKQQTMFTLTGIETLQQTVARYWRAFQSGIRNRKTNEAATPAFLPAGQLTAGTNSLPLFLSKEHEALFTLFMANSQAGCWVYDENNNIVFANKSYTECTSFNGDPIGKHLSEVFPGVLSEKLIHRNRELLLSGKPGTSEHAYTRADGTPGYFMSSSFVFQSKDGKRYIGGQAIDITDRKQMEKNHERYKFVINATSEAIWDYDIQSNDVYRSEAFYKISGYSKAETENNLTWWMDKIHPEDKESVEANVFNALNAGNTNWQDEYRFLYADGTYHYILDKGYAVYENGRPVRLIGAIQDITDRKILEQQLLTEQVQKQKLINQATIDAQEKERGKISAELHDNVNQLLMSAKLHIGAAKNNENANELMSKASEYILEAVEEIRGLSHRLNSTIVKTVGLEASINDICRNMKQFSDIEVYAAIQQEVTSKLSQEQQLVIFRVVQEQSSNIIKYARAENVTIALTDHHTHCSLTISDDGIGFDKTKQKANGIGFINIFNRVDAYNGKTEIITYPDNGCTLRVTLPYTV